MNRLYRYIFSSNYHPELASNSCVCRDGPDQLLYDSIDHKRDVNILRIGFRNLMDANCLI
jgi:hypothetical protein